MKGQKMKKSYLILGLMIVSSSALGMQNFSENRRDDVYKSGVFSELVKKNKSFSRPLWEREVTKETKQSLSEFDNRLLKAVKENDLETVKKFLGIDIKTIEDMVLRSNNSKALHKNLGRYVYIRTRTNINAQDENGNTPLMWAIRNSNWEIVDLLLGCKDIDFNKKNKNGNIALDFAIMRECVDIIGSERPKASILHKDIMVLKKVSPRIIASVPDSWIIVSPVIDNNFTKIDLLKNYAEEVYKITNIGEERRQRMVDGAEDLVNFRNKYPSINIWKLVSNWYNSTDVLSVDQLVLGFKPIFRFRQNYQNEEHGSEEVNDSIYPLGRD